MSNVMNIEKLSDYVYRIPKTGRMNVEGRVYANNELLETQKNDEAIAQVRNVACLPGIVKYSIAMPDFHWGYGFPIGGVAAFDLDEGVISPGGVGFDINCGVRVVRTGLTRESFMEKREKAVASIFQQIPTGIGKGSGVKKLSKSEMKNCAENGARWAVKNGLADEDDLAHIEEGGILEGADFGTVSEDAISRGRGQLGSLGSGNHFLEIQAVEEIYDKIVADALGLEKGQIVYSIHCGSRGFGHQICDDYLKVMSRASNTYNIYLPDKQLCCAPFKSPEAMKYFSAMKCAANFAWCNRQVINFLVNKTLKKVFNMKDEQLKAEIIYDVCHNIAKVEEHIVDKRRMKLCVHRKGATRALPPGHPLTPDAYKSVGQPVLIPGDMGRASFILVGTKKGMEETFCSSAHGAGRIRSRKQMKKLMRDRDLFNLLKNSYDVVVKSKSISSVAEEMPDAYKDASVVANVTERAGISRKIARMKPLCCIKG